MNNNVDSFTDEVFLNIVNRTILEITEYSLDNFTGGYVSPTTAYNHKLIKYTVALFFGYKEVDGSEGEKKKIRKTPVTKKFDINEDEYFLWSKAILVKTLSMKTNTIDSSLNRINALIKPLSKEEEKEIEKRSEQNVPRDIQGDTKDNLPNTSTKLPSTSLSNTSYENELKKVVELFDSERKKIVFNFVRGEYKNQDGESLLSVHLSETKRTPEMYLDAVKWLFSNNPKAEFHRGYIMNIGLLLKHFNTLEHQAINSKESIKFNEEAQSWANVYRKKGFSDEEILEKLRTGGYVQ